MSDPDAIIDAIRHLSSILGQQAYHTTIRVPRHVLRDIMSARVWCNAAPARIAPVGSPFPGETRLYEIKLEAQEDGR